MADEVTEAQQRRWVRQIAEALVEVVVSEVPEVELPGVLLALARHFEGAARARHPVAHAGSPEVVP